MSEESDSKKNKDLDIFIANSTYPDAEPIFTVRPKTLEEIKSDCFVVLDTNSLLVPYTISKESLEQIRNTCKALAAEKRLVVPGQVAREFAKNRANKITELYQQLSAKRDSASSIKKGTYPLLESFEEYQKALGIEDEINGLLTKYREAVTKVLEHIKGWAWDDPVSLLYGELFTDGVVIDTPLDEGKMKAELSRRKLHNIPPGYKDTGAGDLLIWFTILDIGRTYKKSVIFVSGDEKSDWYHKSNQEALYPRYELVDEYRRNSDGQSFHIIQFSRFLYLYGANEKVVEEVRNEETQVRSVQTQRLDKLELQSQATLNQAKRHYIDKYGLDNFLIDGYDLEHTYIKAAFNISDRVGEFLDYISRYPNLDSDGREVVSWLYTLEDEYLIKAFNIARKKYNFIKIDPTF